MRRRSVVIALWGSLVLAGCAVVAPPPQSAPVPMQLPAPTPRVVEGHEVRVWYATNRQPTNQPFDALEPFGAVRDHKLNYGTVKVWVPTARKRGSLGSWSGGWVKFRAADSMVEGEFWRGFKTTLQQVSGNGKVVMVFIHGYNNSFKDAAERTAQLWVDLDLHGVPAFFSWPALQAPLKYTVDEATIDYSERYLEEFLVRLRREAGPSQPIHLIAHSMGNRALLRVAQRVQNKLRFGQVILAAPDVDVDVFNQLAGAYNAISERTTIYVARNDFPVELSQQLHGAERVGSPPSFVQVANIDTVEVDAPRKLYEMGHSYFAELDPMLDEIAALIKENPGRSKFFPGKRIDARATCGLTSFVIKTQNACWRIQVAD